MTTAPDPPPAPLRVLLTGMSGVGKSALVAELRRRGHAAYDADDDGFSEPRADGRWGWRAELVADLLARHTDGLLFFAGCSEEQIALPFDVRVLLTVPQPVLVEHLRELGRPRPDHHRAAARARGPPAQAHRRARRAPRAGPPRGRQLRRPRRRRLPLVTVAAHRHGGSAHSARTRAAGPPPAARARRRARRCAPVGIAGRAWTGP